MKFINKASAVFGSLLVVTGCGGDSGGVAGGVDTLTSPVVDNQSVGGTEELPCLDPSGDGIIVSAPDGGLTLVGGQPDNAVQCIDELNGTVWGTLCLQQDLGESSEPRFARAVVIYHVNERGMYFDDQIVQIFSYYLDSDCSIPATPATEVYRGAYELQGSAFPTALGNATFIDVTIKEVTIDDVNIPLPVESIREVYDLVLITDDGLMYWGAHDGNNTSPELRPRTLNTDFFFISATDS